MTALRVLEGHLGHGLALGVVRRRIAHRLLDGEARARTPDLFDAASAAPPVDAARLGIVAVTMKRVIVHHKHRVAHLGGHERDRLVLER